ncbi:MULTISPECIES: DUF4192 domain-containing protein [Streptomyces]|uniref:DUF4192 domain-containing protein n=2 Tax=Streptomyces TaxID=1883 RepID=A0A2U9P881_STRAS|nr:DUF4192 domain-containing protein [Streptomyces actuosus]AWT45926.1 DUF4192 domain-containing protein [Streptomyces actuosus]MBM4822572.1 DUF4192 family protein [Streptomyces actuosus]
MTNHGETTGSFENGESAGYVGSGDSTGYYHRSSVAGAADLPADDAFPGLPGPAEPCQVTLRTASELADALPYLLGYRPEDSIVLVALHNNDGRGRFGGRARVGIPPNPADWTAAVRQLAHGLVTGSERRGARPEQLVAYVCQEPAEGETGRQVRERLGPLAHQLRVECGLLDVPVVEALCISDGRFWSYCCSGEACCPPEGLPMGLPGTSVLAAAAAYAGIQVRGTLRELRARLLPWEHTAALEQEVALDTAGLALVRRMLDETEGARVAEETLALAERILRRYAEAPPVSGTLTADRRDDGLLTHDEAARLILGLQDRTTRDRAAEWMEGDEAGPALRLWRALARRCVGPYAEHAAAPLTLAGWVAWSAGDDIEAREALAMALGADPDYLFARLLHQALNQGLDPESVRRCLRTERRTRGRGTAAEAAEPSSGPGSESRLELGSRSIAHPVAGSSGGPGAEPMALPIAEPQCEPSPEPPTAPAPSLADAPETPARRRRRPRGQALDAPPRPATSRADTAGRSGGKSGPSARSTAPGRRASTERPEPTGPRTSGKSTGRRGARRAGPLSPGVDGSPPATGEGGEGA